MNEHEEWLYEDGASANFTTYTKKEKEILKKFEAYEGRKSFASEIEITMDSAAKTFAEIENKLTDL
jgi:hypothetical protein